MITIRNTQYAIRSMQYVVRNTQYAGVLSFTAECYNLTFLREDYLVGWVLRNRTVRHLLGDK